MENTFIPNCPKCHRPMTYFKDAPEEPRGGSQISVPLASDIFKCDEHGLWRCYISGGIKRYTEPVK